MEDRGNEPIPSSHGTASSPRSAQSDISGERAYYEDADLWRPELFDTAGERRRLEACGSLVPDGVATLLDVGCGQGGFLQWLSVNRPTLRVEGLERSAAAREVAAAFGVVREGSIEALPYEDGAFDVIAALEVLEHLPHGTYETGLSELARVARRAIVISVPHAERRELVRCTYCNCRFQPNYHMRSFDRDRFASLFHGFGLERHDVLLSEDYVGGAVLRAGYRLLRGGVDDAPAGTMCPQCGFRQGGTAAVREWARRSFRARLPTRMRPRWLVGRFVRATR